MKGIRKPNAYTALRYFFGGLLAICASLFLNDAIIGIWYKLIGRPIFGAFGSSQWHDLLVLSTTAVFTCLCLVCRHRMSKTLWLLFSSYILFYIEFRICGDYSLFPLTKFHWLPATNEFYADTVLVGMLIYVLTSFLRGKSQAAASVNPKAGLFFEDGSTYEDLLGHRKMAKVLAKLIKTEYSHKDNAIGIAVTGEWGVGKSTFLSYLDEQLAGCIKVMFDPWVENSKDITTDMLERVEAALRNKDTGLARIFKRYINKLNVSNVTGWFNLSLLAIREMFNPETEAERKENLRKALRKLDNPVVIFVDDSDRLPSSQFLETISLIRGIADLPNIVFVVAFDAQRANDKLKDYGGEDFMRKMFNVVHPLQSVDKNVIYEQLQKNLDLIGCAMSDASFGSDELEATKSFYNFLPSVSDLPHFLPTLREVKRFCNLVEKDYSLMGNTDAAHFIDPCQWVALELLKYTDLVTYSMLSASPSSYLEKRTLFGMNSPYYCVKDKASIGNTWSAKLIHNLFPEEVGQQNDTFLISNLRYFNLYFDAHLPENYVKFEHYARFVIRKWDSPDVQSSKCEAFKEFIRSNWKNYRTSNIDSVACEILKTYPPKMLFPILELIVKEYHANKGMANFGELSEKDNYRKYSRIVRNHIYLAVLAINAIETICVPNDDEPISDDIILKSKEPLIQCALLNRQIKSWDFDGRIASDGFLFEILKNLVNEGKHEDVIWIVTDCDSCILPEEFLKDYLDNHFLDFLQYLLWSDENHFTGEKMLRVDINAIEGLFLSYDEFKSTLNRWEYENRYPIDLLKEFRRIVGLSNFHARNNEHLAATKFPLLGKHLRKGDYDAISDSVLRSDSFWTEGNRLEERT